ncbi:MAG TPA: hypothetical protein VNR70_15715 [Steroidobacteraceae bacterium]|nr:hypothetical protein [Steroidobacteraceae bacterium]
MSYPKTRKVVITQRFLDSETMSYLRASGCDVVTIDIYDRTVRSRNHLAHFSLSARHHRMFVDGLDLVCSSLAQRGEIAAFEQVHWAEQPWLKAVAAVTRKRLSG